MERLIGKVFTTVERGEYDGNDAVLFDDDFAVTHVQGCCESVWLADVEGDLSDLQGSPITHSEISYQDNPLASESGTWSFVRLATEKGWVVLRFCGESNGYYSESAGLIKLK